MSTIRNYLPYDHAKDNITECKGHINQWIELVKRTTSNQREFILYLFNLESSNIELLEPYFNQEFANKLKRLDNGKHQAHFNDNLFTLYSPQSRNITIRDDASCIAVYVEQADLFALEDVHHIKEILLIPWQNIDDYLSFQKASKQFNADEDLSSFEPSYDLDKNFLTEFHIIVEGTPVTEKSLSQHIGSPNDISRIKQGLKNLRRIADLIIPHKDDLIGYLLYQYKNSKTGQKGCTFDNSQFIAKYLFDDNENSR